MRRRPSEPRADAQSSWVGNPMTSADQAQRKNALRVITRLRRSAAAHRSSADVQDAAAADRTRHARPWHAWRASGQRDAAEADDQRAERLSEDWPPGS